MQTRRKFDDDGTKCPQFGKSVAGGLQRSNGRIRDRRKRVVLHWTCANACRDDTHKTTDS